MSSGQISRDGACFLFIYLRVLVNTMNKKLEKEAMEQEIDE
jgi:hypothetical protein